MTNKKEKKDETTQVTNGVYKGKNPKKRKINDMFLGAVVQQKKQEYLYIFES